MGWLHKQPGQTMGFWQRRFFVCAEGYLSYFKAEDSKPVAKFSLAGSDARVLKVDSSEQVLRWAVRDAEAPMPEGE